MVKRYLDEREVWELTTDQWREWVRLSGLTARKLALLSGKSVLSICRLLGGGQTWTATKIAVARVLVDHGAKLPPPGRPEHADLRAGDPALR